MKVGFVGLGLMGKWMAKNILSGGHQLLINDIDSRVGSNGSYMERYSC